MKKIICAFLILFVFSCPLSAGELYNCIDRNGNSIITDNPQDGMNNCELKDSYKDPTPEEREEKEYIEQQKATKEKEREKKETEKKGSLGWLNDKRLDCEAKCHGARNTCDSDCRHSSFRSCRKSCFEDYDRCMYNNRCNE